MDEENFQRPNRIRNSPLIGRCSALSQDYEINMDEVVDWPTRQRTGMTWDAYVKNQYENSEKKKLITFFANTPTAAMDSNLCMAG